MANKINYNNKAPFQTLEEIPDENKVNADDMNEIKTVVNNNADELDTAKENIENLQNNQGALDTEITTLKSKVQTLENDNLTNKANISALQEDNNTNKSNITNLQNNKVDKEEGKGLSTNDFTNEYKQKLESLNNYDDTEIKQDIENLKAENEKLKENQIHITTDQSSNINVQDCSNLEGRIDVEGNSVQETRSGYNLLDVPEVLEISIFKEIEVNLKANNTYTFKFDNAIAGSDNNVSMITFRNTTDVITKNLNTSTTKKIEVQPTQDITNVRIYASTDYSSSVGKTKTFQKLMIYEGTGDKEYEQYGAMPSPEYPSEIQNVEGSIPITICNKNIFDSKIIPNSSIITVNDDQSITLKNNTNASGYVNTGVKLKELCKGLKVGDVAHLKLITTFSNKGIYLQGSNSYSWTNGYSKTITEDMLEDTVIVYGGYQKIDILKIQISLNKLEEYVEHQSQTITFPLQEGQKLMKGDYPADAGIHHKRKQFELDGISLKVRDIFKYTNGLYYCTVTMPFISINNSDGCSTHFKWLKQGIVQINCCYVTAGGSTLVFVLEDQNITTVESANNWLIQQKQAGTPVKFECELAEEVIEPYTEEQQEAYNQLQNVLPYKTVTNIFTALALLKFNYIADTKTYIDNKYNNLAQQLLNL